MKRIITTCLALAAIAGPAFAQSASPARAERKAPSAEHRIATDPERLDAGWLRPGETGERTVRVVNTSGGVVNLLRVTSSCSCTVPELEDDQKILRPGESVELEIGLKATANPGPMQQRVYIWYEGSRAPYELLVSADVSHAVKADPAFVMLLGQKTGRIKLSSLDGRPFRVLSADGREPELTDEAGDPIDASKRIEEAYVSFDYEGVAPRDLSRWFVIETDHPEATELPLRVIHQSLYQTDARQTWNLATDRVILGRMQPGDEATKELRLKMVARPDDVAGLSIDDEAIDAEILETRVEGREIVLKVRFVATGARTGLIKARLAVEAEGQTQEADVIVRVEELQ